MIWNTHDENCDMLSTLAACNIRAVMMHGNPQYIALVCVMQTLTCFEDCSSAPVCCACECRSATYGTDVSR
jgi:hypothetical protein